MQRVKKKVKNKKKICGYKTRDNEDQNEGKL